MWAVPDPSSVILSYHERSSISNMKQVVILTLCGKDMSQGLSLLHRVLTEGPEGGWRSALFLREQPAPRFETGGSSEQTKYTDKYTKQPTQFNEWLN